MRWTWITPDSLLWSHSIWWVDCPFVKCLASLPTQRKCSRPGALALARRVLSASMLVFSVRQTYGTFRRCSRSAGRTQSLLTRQNTCERHTAIHVFTSARTALCMTSTSGLPLFRIDTQPWINSKPPLRQRMRSFRTGIRQLLEPYLIAKETWPVKTKAWGRGSNKKPAMGSFASDAAPTSWTCACQRSTWPFLMSFTRHLRMSSRICVVNKTSFQKNRANTLSSSAQASSVWGRFTTWFNQHCLAVIAYLEMNKRACKREETWLILLFVVYETACLTAVASKLQQRPNTLLCIQHHTLVRLSDKNCSEASIVHPSSDSQHATTDPTTHSLFCSSRYAMAISAVSSFMEDLGALVKDNLRTNCNCQH